MTNRIRDEYTRINAILEPLIEQHGFAFEYHNIYGYLPHITQTLNDYVSISIRDELKFEGRAGKHTIAAHASVCHMNPNSDTDELRRAAREIERGADLADAINNLGLGFTERYE